MRKKEKFAKLFIEKLAYGEALSLMNRAFSAGRGYTFQIKFRFLTVEIHISEESKWAF
ncbi:MAG: hypothetical protein ABTQ25_04870 [Nitrosomonas ureae]